ncbi:hypothetical protein JCM6882_007896 [Rhodosporidiobolus microsporus]
MADSELPLTAIITGGASGIGLALARTLLAQSPFPSSSSSPSLTPTYNLLLIDLSPTRLSTVAAELGAEYGAGRVRWHAADVTDYAALGEGFRKARERGEGEEKWNGRVDVVCAIAGISQVFNTPDGKDPFLASARLPSSTSTDGDAQPAKAPSYAVIEVNLKGVLNTVHLAIAHFRAQPPDPLTSLRGRLVCAGSSASIYPFPNESLYGTAKHGVLGMIRSLAPTLLPEGITINGIAPSIVQTGIGNAEALAAIRDAGCMTPMATVTDAVRDVLLSREEAGRKVTGQLLELCLSHVLLRVPPVPANAAELKCLELMWPWAEIEASVGAAGREGGSVRRWVEGKGVKVVREA